MTPKNGTKDDLHSSFFKDLQRADRDRMLAASLAPRSKRPGLLALLAFNAELGRVREVVTQPVLGQIRLQWWRDVLDEIYSNNTVRRHPVAHLLAECARRHRLPRIYLQQLVDTREQDLVEVPFADAAGLDAYADGTGGSLTLARLEVLGAGGEETKRAGQEIGAAWALTGIIRAIPFHARFHRVLLPEDMLRAGGIDAEALFAGQPQAGLPHVVEAIVTMARDRLQRGRDRRLYTERSALPALLEAKLAELYLRRIEAAGYDPFHGLVAQPLPLAAWHLLSGFVRRRY